MMQVFIKYPHRRTKSHASTIKICHKINLKSILYSFLNILLYITENGNLWISLLNPLTSVTIFHIFHIFGDVHLFLDATF